MNVSLAIAKALIFERSRRTSSLVLLVFMALSGYFFLPTTWRFFDARGIYTSAYVGSAVAERSTLIFAILGFFLVRGSIEYDRRSRIGEILASTPLKRLSYLLGKMLGTVAYLCMFMLIVASMAALMQVLSQEAIFQPFELLKPFLLGTFPVMVFVSGLALLFDSLPLLRSWPGDVIFILYLFRTLSFGDLSGGLTSMLARYSYLTTHPEAFIETASGKAFIWPGMTYSLEMVLDRMKWIFLGLGFLLASSPLFDRFTRPPSIAFRLPGLLTDRKKQEFLPVDKTLFTSIPTTSADFTPRWRSMLNSVIAEVVLVLKGRWWYLLAGVGFVGVSLIIPGESLRRYAVPIALLLPIGAIADIGCREYLQGTREFIFSSQGIRDWYPVWKWCAGVILSGLIVVGPVLVMLLKEQFAPALALTVGISFISALAVSSSIWTNGYRMFIVVYVFLWWTMVSGIEKNAPVWLDFVGVWYGGANLTVILLYLILTIGLLALAMIPIRWRKA